jgi:hypothetical protein
MCRRLQAGNKQRAVRFHKIVGRFWFHAYTSCCMGSCCACPLGSLMSSDAPGTKEINIQSKRYAIIVIVISPPAC